MSPSSSKTRLSSFLRKNKVALFLRWSYRLLLLVVIMDISYLVGIWPDWDLHQEGTVQPSNFIRDYIHQKRQHDEWPELSWQQKPINEISEHVIRALIVGEDSRFYSHTGIDLEAFQTAMEQNLSKKRLIYGGSTISQQTVKNMFLSASRNPLRKWHELVITIGMEQNLSKSRILELYLNVAEFGRGIYGVEAASQHYWGISSSELSARQAIELAATLPSPVKHNPATRTRTFKNRVQRINRYF